MTRERPHISVIICTYNRSALLERALRAFRDQAPAPSAEIVVVDNNSSDDTAEVTRRYAENLRAIVPVIYVHEPTQGLSRARNAGIEAARGEILAFLDDDAVPSPGWLAAVADVFSAHPDAAAAGGPIEPEFEIPRPDWLGPALEGYYSILDLGPETRAFPRKHIPFGANMALRRTSLGDLRFSEALGRKGASLESDEERALFRQLRADGGQIVYAPPMRVRHFVPRERLSVDWLLARSAGGGVSRARLAKGPLQRLALLVRIVLAYAVTEGAHVLGMERDPLLRRCRKAHYATICRTLFARGPSEPTAPERQ